MMLDNLIEVPKRGKIVNEEDLKKDRRKAYSLLSQAFILAAGLTYLMYIIPL